MTVMIRIGNDVVPLNDLHVAVNEAKLVFRIASSERHIDNYEFKDHNMAVDALEVFSREISSLPVNNKPVFVLDMRKPNLLVKMGETIDTSSSKKNPRP